MKLKPRLPEGRDILKAPPYFSIISKGSVREKKKLELPLPLMMPRRKGLPRPIPRVKRGILRKDQIQTPMPNPEKVPLILKTVRAFRSLLTREGELIWPNKMPTYPTLDYQRLYTRYPAMKTVTKVTDANGKITVDFHRPFDGIPGVVMTVKGSEAISGNVTNVTATNFEAIFYGFEHSHGGTVNDGGGHTPTINADGAHSHGVQGTIYYTKYKCWGGLTGGIWSDYQSAYGDPHRHQISVSEQWNHYMWDVVIDALTLWMSYHESPSHGHTGGYVDEHDHYIAPDGSTLLTNTSVTITYLAQVESEI